MIYIADGPSDIPSFSVVKSAGGLAYAVYNPARQDEFAQNDRLRQVGRIDHYGPADYTEGGATPNWLRLHIQGICDRIVSEADSAVAKRTSKPPRHLTTAPQKAAPSGPVHRTTRQGSFLD
jgi:hypothetical protein